MHRPEYWSYVDFNVRALHTPLLRMVCMIWFVGGVKTPLHLIYPERFLQLPNPPLREMRGWYLIPSLSSQ